MISKIIPSESFESAIHSIYQDTNNNVVLLAQGVRDYDKNLMIQDFERQQALRSEEKSACFHVALSFSELEQFEDTKLEKIVLEYLTEMGLAKTQYIVIKQVEKIPLYLHMLANLVDDGGNRIKNNCAGLTGKKVAQHLTKQYGLTSADKKNLAQTNLGALNGFESDRYRVYLAIHSCLPSCKTLEELIGRLKGQGIETLIKCKPGSDEQIGISFKIGKNCFKGSKVDRAFSLSQLKLRLKKDSDSD